MTNTDIQKLFLYFRDLILKSIPYCEVEHVGGSSIPGINTKGDLDIQIRVTGEDFNNAIVDCQKIFTVKYQEIWTDEFALFGDLNQAIKIDVMLTVKGSAYDNFFLIRDAMIADKKLQIRYNELKEHYPDFKSEEYRKAKHVFFRQLETELGLKVRPIENFPNKLN